MIRRQTQMRETADQLKICAHSLDEGRIGIQIREHYAPGNKGKLLLVEDEPLSQKYCQLLLLNVGYQLDIADNGESALEHIANQHYESILMDVGLPDTSGIEVARIIRTSNNPNREIPIIAITAHLDASKQDACFEAGMTAFLIKPVSPNVLCEVLAFSLRRISG